jgi:hypothetical protein
MDEKDSTGGPEGLGTADAFEAKHSPEQDGEDTTPAHEQQLAEEADARADSAYNDPIGGMPIA